MTQEPKWEITEHVWHGVAILTNGYQWHAYVEHVDAPQHSTWAGCVFESLQDAQAWCKAEIALLRKRHGDAPEDAPAAAPEVQDAWTWLWNTLTSELGEARAAQIRAEFAQRRHTETHPDTA